MISTKGRYALSVMLDLAQHDGESYIPLKDIAQRQSLSKKYLESIVRDLVSSKLITGVSGKGGGYRLCRAPEDYTIGEILELMEGPLSPVSCLACDAAPCPRASECKTLPLWEGYDQLTHDYFYGKRLVDLIRQPGE